MKRLKPTHALLAAAALVGTVSCGNGAPAGPVEEPPAADPSRQAEPGEKLGSLSFELTAQGGVKFDSFSYAIVGPNFSKSGNIDVSNSTTVSALIDGIPAASGYSITLQGTSAAPAKATCSGSATFAITAAAVTNVPVALSCHLQDQVPPTPVPLPPLAPVVLGVILLAIGTVSTSRKRKSSA